MVINPRVEHDDLDEFSACIFSSWCKIASRMNRFCYSILFLCLGGPVFLAAQEEEPFYEGENFVIPGLGLAGQGVATPEAQARLNDSFIPNYTVASAYYLQTFDADFSDGAGDKFSLREFGIAADFPIVNKPKTLLTAGIRYRNHKVETRTFFDFSEFTLHSIEIPVNFRKQLSPRWSLWARLAPGVYSDFEDLGSDDVGFTAMALLSYRWNQYVDVAFGGVYTRDLGDERFLPALGAIVRPNDQLSIALTFPRAQVTYAASRDLLLSGKLAFAGGSWNIVDQGEDIVYNYSALRAGIGVESRLRDDWWSYFDIGFEFNREDEFEAASGNFPLEIENGLYFTGGVRKRF